MTISLARYVDITSGIGAGNNVSTRNLGGLIITSNALVPTGAVVNFSSAVAVGAYFGTSSEEYARALFYFGWISKNITTPQQLSFWNWNNNTATGSLIYGVQETFTLATFTAITTGDFTLTLGGYTDHLTGVNLGSAGSLAAVASTLQTAIRAVSAGGTAWTGATVAYVASPSQGGLPQFTLTSGATGTDVISISAGSITDLAGPLGWLTGAILSNGTNAQTAATNFNNLYETTNNFGSFCYTTALAVSLANIEAVASANNALNPNVQFLFSVQVSVANASAWSAGLATTGGVTLTLASPVTGEYPEMAPMMILAATDYTARNSVQSYMFQQFALTPSVTTDAAANTYDALLVNYYGQTQTAGQLISFYQRGVMFGLATQPADQNIYANEIWMKDAIGASIMTLLLSLAQIPANTTGQSQLLGAIQTIINQALFNGTISVGKTLSTAQQLYITQATGNATAWRQVQSTGYWVNVVIQPYVVSGVTEYKAVYTLIYSKDDTIRLVTGFDILI